jgi:hypothetical protein
MHFNWLLLDPRFIVCKQVHARPLCPMHDDGETRSWLRFLAVACLCVVVVALPGMARAASESGSVAKVALVIGNAAYPDPLPNPVNDAKAVASALRSQGFAVVEVHDASRQQMVAAIGQMRDALRGKGGIGLFYYAGHGMQLEWRNYLVPVDAKLRAADEVSSQTLDLQAVLSAFKAAGTRLNIVVLDACRDNPFGATASGKGLAQMDAPPGTFIAYATAPGNVAYERDGDSNGIYTKYLVAEMKRADARIEDVFKRVRVLVRQDTEGKQVPWESTSLEEEFTFGKGIGSPPTASGNQRDAAFIEEKTSWDKIKESADVNDFYAYIKSYPNGFFAELASFRLERLQPARVEVARSETTPPPPSLDSRFRVGDEFRYEHVDRMTGKTSSGQARVTKIENGLIYFNNNPFPVLTQDGGILRRNNLVFDPPIMQHSADLAIGKKWRTAFNVTLPNGGRSRNYWDFKVVDVATVRLPIGDRRAFKVVGQGEGVGDAGPRHSSKFEITFWIDAITLLQIKTEYRSWDSSQRTLESFTRETVYLKQVPR